MKKIITSVVALALFLSFGFFIYSCSEEECKNCVIKTYDSENTDSIISTVDQGEYCGEDLEDVDGSESTDPEGFRSVWVCD